MRVQVLKTVKVSGHPATLSKQQIHKPRARVGGNEEP